MAATNEPQTPGGDEKQVDEVSPAQLPYDDQCERCGAGAEDGSNFCNECLLMADEEDLDSDSGPVQPDENDGITIIRGGADRGRRTWAAKEPLTAKKRVLFEVGPRGAVEEEDEEDDSERDSIDDDTPDILGYLGDFPSLGAVTKISMLRAAANYLSSQQRAALPWVAPKPKAKKGTTFITKKRPRE